MTQTQTPNLTQIRKTIEFLVENLRQGKAIKEIIKEIIAKRPLKEEWEMNVYRLADFIDTLRLRFEKRFSDEKVHDPRRKAADTLIEILTKTVLPKVEELEKAFKDFPIEIKMLAKNYEGIELCVSLTEYIDGEKFNAYREIAKKLQLKYDGQGGNCVQVLKL
jgi:uncharacterized coiled-coil DUF342 family protein